MNQPNKKEGTKDNEMILKGKNMKFFCKYFHPHRAFTNAPVKHPGEGITFREYEEKVAGQTHSQMGIMEMNGKNASFVVWNMKRKEDTAYVYKYFKNEHIRYFLIIKNCSCISIWHQDITRGVHRSDFTLAAHSLCELCKKIDYLDWSGTYYWARVAYSIHLFHHKPSVSKAILPEDLYYRLL